MPRIPGGYGGGSGGGSPEGGGGGGGGTLGLKTCLIHSAIVAFLTSGCHNGGLIVSVATSSSSHLLTENMWRTLTEAGEVHSHAALAEKIPLCSASPGANSRA